jgi:hypothetical protein
MIVDEQTNTVKTTKKVFVDLLNAQTIAGPKTLTDVLTVALAIPQFRLFEIGAAADEGKWRLIAVDETLKLQTLNDAESVVASILEVTRTGQVVDVLNIGAASLRHNGSDVIIASGAQNIGGSKTFTDILTLALATPQFRLFETGAAADEGKWRLIAVDETLKLQTLNDAESVVASVLEVTRTGQVVDVLNIGSTNLQHNGAEVIIDTNVASTTAKGIVELATSGEVQTGTDTERAVTPAGLASKLPLLTKVIDILDWNMSTTSNVAVAHGVTFANIRSITALIRNDAANVYTNLMDITTFGSPTGESRITAAATNINLHRQSGGAFDDANYDSTSYNRGWITIMYIA